MSNKYFDLLKPNIDAFGVITQNAHNNWDGGDTTQREGMFICAMWMHYQAGRISAQDWVNAQGRYLNVMNRLQYHAGWSLRRHPDITKWYGDTNRMSRDQLTSNLAGLGYAYPDLLKSLLKKHALRAMLFTTNTRMNAALKGTPEYKWKLPDITFSSIWGAYIRGLNWKLLWPLLPIFDLELLVGSLIMVYKTKYVPTFNDHLSHQMLLLQSEYRMPSPTSKLAMWIYKKWCKPQAALDAYFRPEMDGPLLNDIYREIWAD